MRGGILIKIQYTDAHKDRSNGKTVSFGIWTFLDTVLQLSVCDGGDTQVISQVGPYSVMNRPIGKPHCHNNCVGVKFIH